LLARDGEGLERVRRMLDAARGQRIGSWSPISAGRKRCGPWLTGFLAESGPVHILVYNTGGPPPGPASEADPGSYLAAFTQHLVCNQVVVQALVPG
jgi:3-oxoacyl-[acyl-carrier protein] reductase